MNENTIKHLNHQFYQEANEYREQVRVGQIIKGSEKYTEPFTPSSWSALELAEHAMQENMDQAHYIYGLAKKAEGLESKVELYETALFGLLGVAGALDNDAMIYDIVDVLIVNEISEHLRNRVLEGAVILSSYQEDDEK